MRTAAFLGICALIAAGIVFLFQIIPTYFGITIPFLDFLIFEVIKVAVFLPIIAFVLNPLNQKLRNWRKKRGRDIEEEEKHETASGFIKLTSNDDE